MQTDHSFAQRPQLLKPAITLIDPARRFGQVNRVLGMLRQQCDGTTPRQRVFHNHFASGRGT
jgi:hypothetical protein